MSRSSLNIIYDNQVNSLTKCSLLNYLGFCFEKGKIETLSILGSVPVIPSLSCMISTWRMHEFPQSYLHFYEWYQLRGSIEVPRSSLHCYVWYQLKRSMKCHNHPFTVIYDINLNDPWSASIIPSLLCMISIWNFNWNYHTVFIWT